MHPDIHRLARAATSGHVEPQPVRDAPRRSVRVRLDDLMVAVGSRTVRIGLTVADAGARRGGHHGRPALRSSGAPPDPVGTR